jgi:glyoxylase-like metal-dependent hydrolase (beta-lactamase superfamily II)
VRPRVGRGRPYPIVYNVGDKLEGLRKMQPLASSPAHVIPGHDPLMLSRYPAAASGLEGFGARVDVAPSA